MTRNVLKNSGINYVEVPNEAAFYGPKIDVQAWSVVGREFSIATNQVDFAQPRSFDLRYKDRDNIDKIPICIHRAPLGTHERFVGFLIEHYAGNFPLWLSPEQVRILTIGDDPKLMDYARSILNELRAHQVRAELDESSDKINGKIQRADNESPHHVCHWETRSRSRCRQRARPWQGQSRRETAGRSCRRHFIVD